MNNRWQGGNIRGSKLLIKLSFCCHGHCSSSGIFCKLRRTAVRPELLTDLEDASLFLSYVPGEFSVSSNRSAVTGQPFLPVAHELPNLDGTGPLASLRKTWPQFFILAAIGGWLYLPVLFQLAHQWWTDPNCSHGFFVPLFSAFVVWRQRSRFADPPNPSSWGLAILLLAMTILVVGIVGADIFLPRVSFLLLIAGLLILFRGWRFFRAVLFPWAFLFLMIPIPALLFDQITFPLQILASKLAAVLLPFCGVPVLREGNIINLPFMALEVAGACSGIRSLLSLATLATIYGYMTETRRSSRIILALASIPIAVTANGLRIVGTGLLAEYWEPSKAEGFFHAFSGWLIFVVSLTLLVLTHQLLRPLHAKAQP